jgi:hypothetical protein
MFNRLRSIPLSVAEERVSSSSMTEKVTKNAMANMTGKNASKTEFSVAYPMMAANVTITHNHCRGYRSAN